MKISDHRIDHGHSFDWGRTSEDYAKYRDIYPDVFYKKIVDRKLCIKGQKVLDIGTGTGVLPRNMYHYGASWIGIDRSPEQIEQARQLAIKQNMLIDFESVSAEDINFSDSSFDVVTACQCFWYFDHEKLMPKLSRMLKDNGHLVILYMAWLPFEDEIAKKSEDLVLKYNPDWTGGHEKRHPIDIPEIAYHYFDVIDHEEYDLKVPFTRESWHGRMKACRGVGASLSGDLLMQWENEHCQHLLHNAPDNFNVLHYAAIAVLQKKK